MVLDLRGLRGARRRGMDRVGGYHHEGVELTATNPIGELQDNRGAF